MSYVINYSGGTITIPTGQANTSNTSLTLIGRNWSSSNIQQGYGQVLNQNFVSLLENFANTTGPANPLTGQLWYDTANSAMNLNSGTPTSPVWTKMYSTGASITDINNGTSGVDIPQFDGNVYISAGGVANVFVVTDVGANVFGNLTSNATITGETIKSTGNVNFTTASNVSLGNVGNIHIGGGSNGQVLTTDGAGNLTWSTVSSNGAITTNSISTGANTTAGDITGTWTLTAGSTLQSTYADLAEYYVIDKSAGVATVVEFGGTKEIKACMTDMSKRVAGVVSTDPAFIMNADSAKPGEIRELVALQGRVPCKVVGKTSKGDLMVSAGHGCARAEENPIMGSVIGKSLVDKYTDGMEIIEIAVGRL